MANVLCEYHHLKAILMDSMGTRVPVYYENKDLVGIIN